VEFADNTPIWHSAAEPDMQSGSGCAAEHTQCVATLQEIKELLWSRSGVARRLQKHSAKCRKLHRVWGTC